MALQISRRGKLYVKQEAVYDDATEDFASTDAMRHIDVGFSYDPKARVTSQEKKSSPGAATRFDRRQTASFDLRSALIHPSGTINTLPEAEQLFEAAIGAVTNVTLDTTVEASPSGTTTSCEVLSAGTLAVGDAVLLSQGGVLYVRVLTSVATNLLGWAEALPSAIITGEQVQGCITYSLSTANAFSITALHTGPGAFKRMLLGAVIDRFGMAFDANEEPTFNMSGPASRQITSSLPSDPAAFTTVGGNPPSGLVGELILGAAGTAFLIKSIGFDITNGMRLRNSEYGTAVASGGYRGGRRDVSLTIEAFAETEATLYDLAEAGTEVSLLKQTGRTVGNIIAVSCPRVEFKVPDTSDGDDEAEWSFSGMCLETADDQNDELKLIFA